MEKMPNNYVVEERGELELYELLLALFHIA